MGDHPDHEMHENSINAFEVLDTQARRKLIEDAYRKCRGSVTDRQVAQWLWRQGSLPSVDMNLVRPRITEMVKLGILAETGSTKCEVTGKTVRVCAWVEPHKRIRISKAQKQLSEAHDRDTTALWLVEFLGYSDRDRTAMGMAHSLVEAFRKGRAPNISWTGN